MDVVRTSILSRVTGPCEHSHEGVGGEGWRNLGPAGRALHEVSTTPDAVWIAVSSN
jgi:hypothetical protein